MPKFFGKNHKKIDKEKSLQSLAPKRISIDRCKSTGALPGNADISPPTPLRYNNHTGVTVRRSPKNDYEQPRYISTGHGYQGNRIRQPFRKLSANVDGLSPETNELVHADDQESTPLAVRFDSDQGLSGKERHTTAPAILRKSLGKSDHSEDFPSLSARKDEKIVDSPGRRGGQVQEVQPLEFQLKANRLTKSFRRSIRRFSKKAKAKNLTADVNISVSERSKLWEKRIHDNVHIEKEERKSGSLEINEKTKLEEEKTHHSVHDQDQEIRELPKGVPENSEIIERNEHTKEKVNKSDKEGGRLEFQVLAEKFSKRKEKFRASFRGTKKKPMNSYEFKVDEQKGKLKSPRPPPAPPKPPKAKNTEAGFKKNISKKIEKGKKLCKRRKDLFMDFFKGLWGNY